MPDPTRTFDGCMAWALAVVLGLGIPAALAWCWLKG